MIDIATVRRTIAEKLAGMQDLGNGILRGERTYQGKTFATAYIDLSDCVVERANDLAGFQERLLGGDFFKADGDQRWNSYLYFWAGPNSRKNTAFRLAKARIEGDRHFARKFVLTEEDLLERLDDVASHTPSKQISTDVSVQWEDILQAASLGVLMDKRPRTQLLELIGSGEAFVAESSQIARVAPELNDDPLGTGLLRRLHVGSFRSAISDRDFQFGDVNLIFGQNGAGKTSLLESIEALYCGRVRRDPTATFSDIEAEVVKLDGASVKVKLTTTAAIIKARNLAWYGRSNQQSSAITQAFTRFNFLDTDAAFRLSSDTNPEQIKNDLSLLLVGAETSSLWTDLTKLRENAIAKRTNLNERIPSLLKQTELLGSDVKRLQALPTVSTTLAKSFRATLRELGCTWTLGDDSAPISPSDRTHLEYLARGFRQAIAATQSTPATTAFLRQRAQSLSSTLDTVDRIADEYSAMLQDLKAKEDLAKQHQTTLSVLQTWVAYCEAGAPVLSASLKRAKTTIAEVRAALGGISIDEVLEVPVEYASRQLQDAIQAATANLQLAVEQERSGIESLQQRERLGQSIAALRSDLRDVAQAVLERTGDALHCPVCRTAHTDGELLRKIEALTATDDPTFTDGLRQAIQVARERAQRERDALTALQTLMHFAKTRKITDTETVSDLVKLIALNQRALADAVAELSRLELATECFTLLGVDWRGYADAQGKATTLLGAELDATDLQVVNTHIAAVLRDLDAVNKASSEARGRLTTLISQAGAAAVTAGIPDSDGSSVMEVATRIQRAARLLETSLEFLDKASHLLILRDDQPLENLELAIEAAINAFDHAQHAERSELNARTDLIKKTEELHEATEQLHVAMTRQENLAKAINVLTNIVEKHSLEKATQEALESIRGHVSNIFARIHSPAEYTLGDFNGEELLATREDLCPRGAHQVSTGQRAALALSIFLALNRNAESAPPVLLIDDPVAHIDDLNALSFLDYLRDLTVSRRKQIFFATADAKLAALFQRKFEFLGAERFKKIVLSR
jgi:exonuclease SbcC